MMGERDPQKQLWSYQVNLDKRVRGDHPLQRINQALDLEFVRPEVAKFYGTKGHVSEDLVVIMKMMLLLFVDSVRSERELMRIIPERLDYMWFLGYGLDDTIPNHSVLSKARKRWGQEVFVAVFSRVVAQCAKAGLVEGTKIHADSSLVGYDNFALDPEPGEQCDAIGTKAFGPSSPTSQYQAGETGSEAPPASDRTQLCRRF
jgi:transposase